MPDSIQEDETEAKESCISFIDEEAEPEGEDGKRKEKLVSIKQIVSTLCTELPDATIKVYKLPVIESTNMTGTDTVQNQ